MATQVRTSGMSWRSVKLTVSYVHMHYMSFHDIATVSYELHACLALCNWTSLACLMLAGMPCSMQLCNCMYCTCIDKPTNALLGVDSAGIHPSSHQTSKQRWAGPGNSAVLGYSGRAEVQEVHRSSQEGVTSHCWAEWGCYWFLEVECPLENSASFPYCHVFKLFFFLFVFACYVQYWCFDPGTLVSWFSLFL